MSNTTTDDSHPARPGKQNDTTNSNNPGSGPTYELRGVAEDQLIDQLPDQRPLPEEPIGGQAPIDEFGIVFFILLLHGIGTLMPWNMFINAGDYFLKYKLAPDGKQDDEELTRIRQNFFYYLGIASQLPNVLFNGLNLIVNVGSGSLNLRVNITLAVELLVFVLTLILVTVDTSTWAVTFFYITIASVVILNMCSGIYQNCVFGIGAGFPGVYTNSILIGTNSSGAFTSIINLVSMIMMPDLKYSALFYFATASTVIIACIVSFNCLQMNSFYRHYRIVKREAPQPIEASKPEEVLIRTPISKMAILSKCWPQCLNVFITFYVTLTLFPNVLTNTDLTKSTAKMGIPNEYLLPFGCFFIFNITALIGNILASYTNWPGKDRTWILVFARFLFVPYFLLFNFLPGERTSAVYINNYACYVIGNILFGLSSGYFSSICMIFVSRGLSSEEAPVAGMLGSFFLVLGIFVGINSWGILKWLV